MLAAAKERSRAGSFTLTSLWNVPLNRNPNFTGRERLLRNLRDGLTSFDSYERTAVICGLSGVGKTQLALEYAYRHRDDYAIIWWVRAEQPTTLLSDFLSLSPHILDERVGGMPPEVAADALRRNLDRRCDWLLIFDNAPDPQALQHVLPQGRAGHVLITSNNPNWREVSRPIQLEPWDRREAVEFLRRRTGLDAADDSAERLAEALGNLPLAMEQAGACIEQAHISFADYLERFQIHRRQLLQVKQPTADYPNTVAATWGLAIAKVQAASQPAADLLNLISFLSPDEIGRDLLLGGREQLPYPLKKAVESRMALDAAVASLLTYSLVDANAKSLSVHRLVAAVTRDRMTEDQRRRWAEMALRLVNDTFAFVSIDVATWGQCSALLPHVMAVTGYAEALRVAPGIASNLLNETGRFLLRQGRFVDAREALERALAMARSIYGEKHPAVSAVVNNLGRAHMRLNNLQEAQHYFEWALGIDEPAYGHDHPHVATIVNNYGMCLLAAGDLETARRQFEWALSVYEAHYGANHAKVASIVNNLGYALRRLRDMEGARACFLRALSIAEVTVGATHPTVASIVHNLGCVLRAMGDLQGARQYFERALLIDQSTYGPTHPDVVRDVDHLGEVLKGLGDREAARSHYHRALINVRRTHSAGHPRAEALQRAMDELSNL